MKRVFLLKWPACRLKYDDESKTISASGKQKGNNSNYKKFEVHLERPLKDIFASVSM